MGDLFNQRQLNILAPQRYTWTFNGPRRSLHNVTRRPFIPFNKVAPQLEGVTVLLSPLWQNVDLVHAFNRIPLTTRPFVIGFESHLPRAFGLERSHYFRSLRRVLASERCKKIVAISNHARKIFFSMHADSSEYDALNRKLEVRFPNIIIPDEAEIEAGRTQHENSETLNVVFVGNHFARKGGCVAVRLAEIAEEQRCPIHVTVISKLEVGAQTWTDPLNPAFFTPFFKLLSLPNVTFHKSLPNAAVLPILRSGDFSLLTTVADTFGFSVIESLANATPVIATRQGALPEFLRHKHDSLLLDLDVNEAGYWRYSSHPERGTEKFERIFRDEIERLAQGAFQMLVPLIGDKATLNRMRCAALKTARTHFDAAVATEYWDSLYEECLASEFQAATAS